MMKTAAKKVLSRIMWMARGTATLMGLAMLLALTVGLASTALAGTGVGARFHLGQTNTVNAVTSLVSSVTGATLILDNNSTASGATALDLQVEKGKPPLSVNSNTRVERLNADSLDGNDSGNFLTSQSVANDSRRLDGIEAFAYFSKFTDSYTEVEQKFGPGSASEGLPFSVHAFCDPGDIALGGGGTDITLGTGDRLVATNPHQSDPRGWTTKFVDVGNGGQFATTVRCADFPPLR